jgi:hypothetical protein
LTATVSGHKQPRPPKLITLDTGIERSRNPCARVTATLSSSTFATPRLVPAGLSFHGAAILDAVALALNGRPWKTLGWCTPAEAFATLLRSVVTTTVATTD